MSKKIIISGFFSVIVLSGCINYKVLTSFVEQTYLLYDFNAFQLTFPIEQVKSYNDVIPNITVTGLPLKMMKARYFMRDSLINEALGLYYKAKKSNPFLKISDYELAKFHFDKKNMDSSLYYSKNAFEALPRNDLYSRLYFRVLTELEMEKELDFSFNKIKNNFILGQWRDYLLSKVEIGTTSKEDLIKLLEEAEGLVADDEQFKILDILIRVGFENLGELSQIIIKAETFYTQKNFIESAILYEKAAKLNPTDYTHYENAALCYYRGNSFKEAENLFRYTLSSFNPQNGKSELYLGLLLYEKKDKKQACEFWNISKKKGFSGSQRVIDAFCK